MNRSRSPLYGGLVLVLVGILFLFGAAGFVSFASISVGLLFVAGGVACGVAYSRRPARWGLAFPATLLAWLGVVIISDAVLPGSSARWGGAGFLLALGVAFLAGFAVSARWGLLIPAGLFVAAAASAAAGEVGLQAVSGAVMLFGLGATFAVLPFAGAPSETRSWAFPVAAVLAAVGAIVLISSITVVAVAWALVLIGAGLLLLLWTALQRQVPRG